MSLSPAKQEHSMTVNLVEGEGSTWRWACPCGLWHKPHPLFQMKQVHFIGPAIDWPAQHIIMLHLITSTQLQGHPQLGVTIATKHKQHLCTIVNHATLVLEQWQVDISGRL